MSTNSSTADVSPSPSVIDSNSTGGDESSSHCVVCGDTVIHRHFGERTCNSCAAFFRRSVSQRRSYMCRQSEACNVNMKRHKNRCAYCRFHRCLTSGMDMNKVLNNIHAFLSEGDGTFLGSVRLWHRGNFVSRLKNHITLYGLNDYHNRWEQPRTGNEFIRATKVEAEVMKEFLRNTGFIDSEKFDSEYEKNLCSNLMFLWMLLELTFITRGHGGHRSKKVYYMDHSYLIYNEDSMSEFYRHHPEVYNPCSLAKFVKITSELFRTGMLCMGGILKAADVIHRLAVDDFERVAILWICLLTKASRTVGSHERSQEYMNTIFRELKTYYEGNYNNVATRFGQLVLCIEALEEAHRLQLQQLTIVRLDYKKPNSHGYDCYSGQFYGTSTE